MSLGISMNDENVIPMDDKLHPIGTLMDGGSVPFGGSTNWRSHRNIWRVIAHRECQVHPYAPARLACVIELAYQEDL